MTVIQESRDLNNTKLKSLISNLQSHEMELIEDEPVEKLKFLTLKYDDHYAKSSPMMKSEKSTHEDGSEEEPKNEEMTFINKRFQYMANKKNMRFSRRGNVFRGTSSIINKDYHKGCFNCKKHGHYINECTKLQKDRPKKGSF